MELVRLKEPFPETDIEWRIQRSGFKNGKPWARVLAYITNRAIQDRLDDVCGPDSWQNEYRPAPSGEGVLCGIGVKLDSGWVWKWDGAENTQFEAIKGGLSGSMKRAAVQWGIGRYLYDLESGFANFDEDGRYRDKIKDEGSGQEAWYKWNPPRLPDWALPGGIPKGALPPKSPADTSVLRDALLSLLKLVENTVGKPKADELRTAIESGKHDGDMAWFKQALARVKTKVQEQEALLAANTTPPRTLGQPTFVKPIDPPAASLNKLGETVGAKAGEKATIQGGLYDHD